MGLKWGWVHARLACMVHRVRLNRWKYLLLLMWSKMPVQRVTSCDGKAFECSNMGVKVGVTWVSHTVCSTCWKFDVGMSHGAWGGSDTTDTVLLWEADLARTVCSYSSCVDAKMFLSVKLCFKVPYKCRNNFSAAYWSRNCFNRQFNAVVFMPTSSTLLMALAFFTWVATLQETQGPFFSGHAFCNYILVGCF